MKKRENLTRSGAGAKTLPSCSFIAELSFISDSISNRETHSNVQINNLMQPRSNLDLLNVETDDSYSHLLVSTQGLSPVSTATNCTRNSLQSPTSSKETPTNISKTTKTRKRKKTDIDFELDSVLAESIKLDIEKSKQNDTEDPDRLFCLSLVQEFKDLKTPKKKRKARLEILRIFCDLSNSDNEA